MTQLSQTTALKKFLDFVTATAPCQSLMMYVNNYIMTRGSILGLPLPTENPQRGMPGRQQPGQQQPQQPDFVLSQNFPTVNLRARLAGMGPFFGQLFSANMRIKAAIEAEANDFVVGQFGGSPANIEPTGEWSWMLRQNPDAPDKLFFFPGTGVSVTLPATKQDGTLTKVTLTGGSVFVLPGGAFYFTTPATNVALAVPPSTTFVVALTVDPSSGVGSVSFLQGGTINADGTVSDGQSWIGPDPL